MLSVYPSGGDFATAFQAATPVVEEFSTTTAWPSRSASLSANNRLTKSGLPPAGVPVTIRTGRVGHGDPGSAAISGADVATRTKAIGNVNIRMREITAGGKGSDESGRMLAPGAAGGADAENAEEDLAA